VTSVRVKICGITSAADAAMCRREGATYLGFIFTPESPRAISPEAAGRIIRDLPDDVIPVGVFVNPSLREISETAHRSGLKAVQLSGDETPEFCSHLTLPVIKVIREGNTGMFNVFATMVDGVSAGQYGGTGVLPDMAFAARCARNSRCFLAGGLTPRNVSDVLSRVSPYAVDVSSGVETSPGVKDPGKVREFCRTVRTYNERRME